LWVGSVAAIACVLVLVLGMAGIEIEQIPEKVPMITMWAAGALTLLAVLVWKFSLPDGDSMEGGMSVWLAVAAGVCGLAAGGMTPSWVAMKPLKKHQQQSESLDLHRQHVCKLLCSVAVPCGVWLRGQRLNRLVKSNH
ncbi:MAG: hypothetical protein QF707_06410, partial [Candidatus Poseidoniaceae archaeon]|nr:hypothetical protein [Candidatus Poseidoniaceae archaeon]